MCPVRPIIRRLFRRSAIGVYAIATACGTAAPAYPGLFGAYNAGPAAYAAWLAGNRRLPGETVAYLGAVGGTAQATLLASQAAVPPPLFVVRRIVSGDQTSPTVSGAQASLFAVRNVGP